MKIITCEQGTQEWYQARCGVPTASNFNRIVTTKGEPSKQRQKYLYQLAGERITGISEESYTNANIQRGKELESEARKLYSFHSGESVSEVGFCLHDEGYGYSPDGLVGEKGLYEGKAPILSTHVEYLLGNTLPLDYFQQCQGGLLVTGREWLDFFSYYPSIKPLLIRVYRDEKFLKALRQQLIEFVQELNEVTKKIR